EEYLVTSNYDEEVIKIEPESDKNIILDYSTSNIESNEEEIFKDIGNHNKRFS
ncbi:5549_t:CDS:1, partial [Cetraspora pellucida]